MTDNAERNAGVKRILVTALWWVVACIALAAWILDPLRLQSGWFKVSVSYGWKPVIALVVVTILARSRSRIRLAVFTSIFTLYLLEGSLAVLGFESGAPAIIIREEGPAPKPEGEAMLSDPYLLWRFKPGANFRGRDVNNLGYLDRTIDPVKAPGVKRVICLGDSCTAQGMPTYARSLHDILQTNAPAGSAWEAFNMGVHGYTVRQGLVVFRDHARPLEPDIVTLYFGWNDHWLAEKPDRERMAMAGSGWRGKLMQCLAKRRVSSAVTRTLKRPQEGAPEASKMLRVPPDDYRETLTRLVRAIQAAGAKPVVITAPRAAKLSTLIVHNGSAASVEEATRLHDEYNGIARDVAKRTGAELFDLAATFTQPEYARYFSNDGIHFEQEGLAQIAAELHGFLGRAK